MTKESLTEWIEKKQYQGALLKYKTPALLSGMRTYWAYAKKDVRKFYRMNIQAKVDPLLIKYSVTYLCDVDPEDLENVKPN